MRFKSLLDSKPVTIAHVLLNDMNRCNVFLHASAMTYTTLLSLVPSLAATFALMSVFSPFFSDTEAVLSAIRNLVLKHLTPGSSEIVMDYMKSFLVNLDIAKIGFTGSVGIFLTLILLLGQIEIALNKIFDVERKRNFIKRFIYFWAFLAILTVAASILAALASGFDLSKLFTLNTPGKGWTFAAKTFSLFGVFTLFTLLYKFVPCRYVSLRQAAKGAAFATVLLVIASNAFTTYVVNFSNYQIIYGALSALPSFLLWIYLLWLIALLGGVLAWRLERGFQTEGDESALEGLSS